MKKKMFAFPLILGLCGANAFAHVGEELKPEETAEIRYFLKLSPEQQLAEIQANTAGAIVRELVKEAAKAGAAEAAKEVVRAVAEKVKEYVRGSKDIDRAGIDPRVFDNLPAPGEVPLVVRSQQYQFQRVAGGPSR